MATVQDLVSAAADALNIDPVTVGNYARVLRETGLFPTGVGGRGCRGPEVDDWHAALLLIGLMASDTAKGCPEVLRLWSDIRPVSLIGRFASQEAEWVEDLTDTRHSETGALAIGIFPQTFADLLTCAIADIRLGTFSAKMFPMQIMVSRSRPLVAVEFGQRCTAMDGVVLGRLTYGLAGEENEPEFVPAPLQGMEVWSRLSSDAIRSIADRLNVAGAASVSAAFSTPISEARH
jgi:hypothetical protein